MRAFTLRWRASRWRNERKRKMNRLMFTFRATVKDGERAFLVRDGRFERVLEPGRHVLFDPRGSLKAEVFNVVRQEFPVDRYEVLARSHPAVAAELFETVTTGPYEVAIVSLDGLPTTVWPPSPGGPTGRSRPASRSRRSIRATCCASPGAGRADQPQALQRRRRGAGGVARGGAPVRQRRVVERLKPGRHAFWKTDREVRIVKIDMRPQPSRSRRRRS